ncbi:MAG: 6-pyruvoyl-tetrahydropterin synthase-related protein [Anaerolineae bacterium]
MARAWREGVLWPRWLPEAYQGLGMPVYHYYSPFFYLLLAPLYLLSLPLDTATKVVLTAFFVASGLAVYAWLQRLLSSPAAGMAGMALYLAGPHLFREYYFQGDYPQLVALLWLPVVFWAFTRLYLDGHGSNWLLAPLSLALLVTAHNITAMLGAALLALYWLTLPFWCRSWAGWLRGALAGFLGAGLSAFFWMPALGDTSLVRVENMRQGFFHYSQYFLSLADLFAPPPLLDSRALNPPFPHHLGWTAWLTVAGGVLAVASPPLAPRSVDFSANLGRSGAGFRRPAALPHSGLGFARVGAPARPRLVAVPRAAPGSSCHRGSADRWRGGCLLG